MEDKEAVVKQLYAVLEHEAHIDVQDNPIDIHVGEGVIMLGGELPSIAQKMQAVRAAAKVANGYDVLDRLNVTPAERIGDGAVRDAVCRLMLRDQDFDHCSIRVRNKGEIETLHECVGEWCGDILITVENGVVTLEGKVISLTHKRLAGVLAWWAAGTRNVLNHLEVRPQEDDNDDEVTDAVRWVFETDPYVHADRLGINTRDYVVTLDGSVSSESERKRAEDDVWCIYGVDNVINRIGVAP